MESLFSSVSDYFSGACTNTPKTIEINNAIITDIKRTKYGGSTTVKFDNIQDSFWINNTIHPDEYKIGDIVSFKYQRLVGISMPIIRGMLIPKNRKFVNCEIIKEGVDYEKKINELSSQINTITQDMSENLFNQLYDQTKQNKITDEYQLLKKKKTDLEKQRDGYIANFEDRISVYKEGWTHF